MPHNADDCLLFSVADPDFTYLGGILNPIPGLVYYLFSSWRFRSVFSASERISSILSRLPVRALGSRWDSTLQSGGAGRKNEARPSRRLHLDDQSYSES